MTSSAPHLYSPESHLFLDSWLCVSAREIWVEWNRKSWREEDPPERHATNRIGLRDLLPIDFLPGSDKALSPAISQVAIKPYADRLLALQEAERVHEMMSTAAYSIRGKSQESLFPWWTDCGSERNASSRRRVMLSGMSKQSLNDGTPSLKRNDRRLPDQSSE